MYHPGFAHIIDGHRTVGSSLGQPVRAEDPYSGEILWEAFAGDAEIVNRSIDAARRAFPGWAKFAYEQRRSIVEQFVALVKDNLPELAAVIAAESGKPLWEAKIEANAVVTKFDASAAAYEDRASESRREVRGALSVTRYLPHGVLVVLSPFNFPASMGNSHVMPALLAGNAVVLKPSELTPLTGLFLAELWQEAGLPPGVMNCVTGDGGTGRLLVENADHDGVLFVGGHQAGRAILNAVGTDPAKIVALELGGNSPLVVWDYEDINAVVHLIIQSTFLSAGQRCTASRRLLIPRTDEQLVPALVDALQRVRVGYHLDEDEPFYGPVIRAEHAQRVVARVDDLVAQGAAPLLRGQQSGPRGTILGPTLLDMSDCTGDADEEIFGPVLKLYRFDSFEEAIRLANETRFGLAAGIVCRDEERFESFRWSVRAGIINWNQQLTGATTYAPFGGVKASGNYRPAGFHSVDYCAYPIASFEVPLPRVPSSVSPGLPF